MAENSQAQVRTSFPYEVEVVEHEWVPLSDGVRLSIKLWKPVPKVEGERFPAVLEAIPYRKDDVCLLDDSVRMAYVAGYGYLCARVDLRGSGDSEGVLFDEYSYQETTDICEVIAWLAALPECTGNVGMTGISWSGFNSLQTAARRPDALKAIITVCSTDDRYDNDVHYMGGSLLAFYQNWWGAIMHEFGLRPPDPAIVGDAWEGMLDERMANDPYLTERWLTHQRRDSYWHTGSVCEDYSAIACPVLAIGGWTDGYTDAILRLLDHLGACTKAIIGLWGHTWAERPVPGPAVGILQENVRWWDRWLKGIENGAEKDPTVRYYLMDACKLSPSLGFRPGSWFEAPSITTPEHVRELALAADGSLACEPATGAAKSAGAADGSGILTHCSSLLCGTQVDTWLPMGSNIDLPSEQTPDDERSLCFDSPELTEDLPIVGQPVVRLRVAADQPEAFVFARLCDVWPDGESHLITRGNLNLTHRDSNADPTPLEPGTFYDVEIPMKAVAQVVPAGHKVRLALSTSYWIWIWPSPKKATISVDCAASELRLPVQNEGDRPLARPFGPAEIAYGERPRIVPNDGFHAIREYDPETGEMSYTRITNDYDSMETPSGMRLTMNKTATYRINEHDPLSAEMETVRGETFSREGWVIDIEVRSKMTCDAEDFHVWTKSKVSHNGKALLDEERTSSVPRDLN